MSVKKKMKNQTKKENAASASQTTVCNATLTTTKTVAFARRVLPVPGGPVNKAPLGILAPISKYFSGIFKKSTN